MFKKKKIEKERELVSCDDCGHVCFKDEVQIVSQTDPTLDYYLPFRSINNRLYYCKGCKKEYEKVRIYQGKNRYYKTIPEHEIEVNEKGKEIKK